MELGNECRSCLLKSQTKKVSSYKDDINKQQFIERITKLCNEISSSSTSPLLMREINLIHKEIFGSSLNYKNEKIKYNNLCLNYCDDINKIISNSSDKLEKAIQFAITGNLIDFAKLTSIDIDLLEYFKNIANNQILDNDILTSLKIDLAKANNIVYLLDNCGEIVFDKILIENIKKLYPNVRITAVVRGEEIINDVTYFDSQMIGLDNVCDVIDNGTDIPGTYLKEVSTNCLEKLQQADVIISKGLGNFETLHKECDFNIYYMFLCKCDYFADMFNVKRMTSILTKERK